jgi:hypothetical protein
LKQGVVEQGVRASHLSCQEAGEGGSVSDAFKRYRQRCHVIGHVMHMERDGDDDDDDDDRSRKGGGTSEAV